ncbi:hypothetical protein OO015_09505 [Thermomicrobium sp. 4228-Ro]|uniref:hypothetical protein n=1 Tax=Thermomicrobium sp. 4228-Ro TaxID=2993937 RepID=UPI0022498949|nr:hypothetical protein [Thermomicrobium sp. 4228-Ro]MCX2727723.1 hypothetical protein [Thermomicrobium sp. 4228-Ro]
MPRSGIAEYTDAMEERSNLRRIAWWFGGIVVGFKVWTVLLVIVFSVDWPTAWYLIFSHLAWFLGLLVLGSGPFLFWYRLFRVRRRREQLLRAEWEISEPTEYRRSRS